MRKGPAAIALVMDRSGPVIWRIIWPFNALNAQGYTAWYCPPDNQRGAELAVGCDVVILSRLAWLRVDMPFAEGFAGALHRQGKVVIMEMDDDLVSEDSMPQLTLLGQQDGMTEREVEDRRQGRLRSLEFCDGVTVTTPQLAQVVERYGGQGVQVVPNAINWPWWQDWLAQTPRIDPRLTIGWAGGRRLAHDTAELAVAWERIAKRFPAVAFKIAGYQDPRLRDAVPEAQRVTTLWEPLESYARAYQGIDIGCCPLADVAFNRCKSPIKAFEFAAAGAAVVASPTVYGEVLQHGKLGLLAQTADEWEAALVDLLEHRQRRHELAARWAKRVRERYSLTQNLHHWPDAWQAVLDARRRRHGKDVRQSPYVVTARPDALSAVERS